MSGMNRTTEKKTTKVLVGAGSAALGLSVAAALTRATMKLVVAFGTVFLAAAGATVYLSLKRRLAASTSA